MKFDFAIVGAGPAGYSFAIRASQLKKKCIVFEENKIGGTCLNIGCIPSKIWINISSLYHTIKNEASQIGIETEKISVNWGKIQEYRTNVISKLQNGIKSLFKAYNIVYKNAQVLKIQDNKVYYTEKGVIQYVEADKIIIAVGCEPVELKEFDYKKPEILTYKNCFNLNTLPQSLVIVGGGIIGIELGQTFSNFGVKVYIVELLDNILSGVDREAVERLIRILKKGDMKIFVHSKVEDVIYTNKGVEVIVKDLKNNETQKFVTEKVIVAVGVRPKDIKAMGDFALTDKGFIKVDENLKTSIDNIYAIGDITGPPFLAHYSYFQGKMLAESLTKNAPLYTTQLIPAVIYTYPEIAYVGLQEEQLQKKKIEYVTSKFHYMASGRAVADNKTDGFIKVFTTPDKKEILGVVICGKNASELISEYTLAMEAKLSLEDISLTIHPHPTYSELIMESAENVLGYTIHSVPY